MSDLYSKTYGDINKYRTSCCALATLSLSNIDTFDEIQEVIETMKDESNEKMTIYETMDTGMKEKAVFVITLPQETILANNLEKLGFKQIAEFHRRNCYFHEDMLKMWFLSWE